MIRVARTIQEWKRVRLSPVFSNQTVGFVPTMGALHEGHLSLARRSQKENQITVVSIFVNPTQFHDAQDLSRYPRVVEQDQEKLSILGVDYLFLPTYEEMYPDGFTYKVTEARVSQELCGLFRPGHFDGVLTVVLKLLNLVGAHRAYFGEKDFQQWELVSGMGRAFFLDTEIVACPTLRDLDGLALSSRNQLLTQAEREKAPAFFRLLNQPLSDQEISKMLEENGFDVDYVQTKSGRRYGAVRLGKVRLIDNVEV